MHLHGYVQEDGKWFVEQDRYEIRTVLQYRHRAKGCKELGLRGHRGCKLRCRVPVREKQSLITSFKSEFCPGKYSKHNPNAQIQQVRTNIIITSTDIDQRFNANANENKEAEDTACSDLDLKPLHLNSY